MKKILLLFIFISTQVFSQFGVKGGVNYTGGVNTISGSELSVGFTAGIFANLESFRPELNFYQQTYASPNIVYNTNYLNLSANYEFLITDALGFIGGLGWDYWLSSSMKVGGTTITLDNSGGIDNLMWNLNFGVAYYISDAIVMDLRYSKPVANGLLENFRLDSGIYGTGLTVGYLLGY